MERRRVARVTSQRDTTTGGMATAPARERVVPEPQFPLGMRNAAMAYASSASIDVVARRGHPGRHVPTDRDLTATTNDESCHGSASELPPATSHGYAEWDFSGIPDPVMFQRLLDAADYWFGYSDHSSAGSYDPTRECFVVVTSDQVNAANTVGAGDKEAPQNSGAGLSWGAGPSAPPRCRRGVPISTRSWPKRVSSRPNSWRSTARCGYFAPPSPEKPPRAANACVS
jgi:hypothetical protein